ncbi:hypothetical protein CPB83DRAFT_750572, partial [Crepidotus variabilis]
YGELQYILECQLDENTVWKEMAGSRLLLAVIKPCKTGGIDAAKGVVLYTEHTTEVVTQLTAVHCVVGRARCQQGWGIIDRSDGLARTEF